MSTNTLFNTVYAGAKPSSPNPHISAPVIVKEDPPQQEAHHSYLKERKLPVFFLDGEEEEVKEIPKSRLARSGSINLGFGDRRLSRLLSDTPQKQPQKEPVHNSATLKKKATNATLGIFGDGRVMDISKDPKKETTDTIKTSPGENATCIRVFGYPPHYEDKLIHFFMRYGTIKEYSHSETGNWTWICYFDAESCKEALKSHGTMLEQRYVIGVIVDTTQTACNIRMVYDEKSGLYNKVVVSNQLVYDKMGIIMYNSNTPDYKTKPIYRGPKAFIKDLLYGW